MLHIPLASSNRGRANARRAGGSGSFQSRQSALGGFSRLLSWPARRISMFLPPASRRGGAFLGTLFAVAVVFAAPNRASATVLRRLTIAELAVESAVIVRARVRDSRGAW